MTNTLQILIEEAKQDFQDELPSFMIFDKLSGSRYVDNDEVNTFLERKLTQAFHAGEANAVEKIKSMSGSYDKVVNRKIRDEAIGVKGFRDFSEQEKHWEVPEWVFEAARQGDKENETL